MMFRLAPTAAALCAGLAIAGTATAQGTEAEAAISARQSHMTLYSHNLGVLGGMARGNIDYDADMATAAAENLAALAALDEQGYWVEGSSNADMPDATRALPAIWENMDAFDEHVAELEEVTADLPEAAGGGLESLQGAMQSVGGACGSCHEEFRESMN